MARPRKSTKPSNPDKRPRWAREFPAWEKRAERYLARTLSIGDAFDADDPYDLGESPFEAWTRGIHPHAFVQQAFSEFFGSLALEDDQRRQAEFEYATEFATEIEDGDASELDEEEPEEDQPEEPKECYGEVIDRMPPEERA